MSFRSIGRNILREHEQEIKLKLKLALPAFGVGYTFGYFTGYLWSTNMERPASMEHHIGFSKFLGNTFGVVSLFGLSPTLGCCTIVGYGMYRRFIVDTV